MKSKITSLFLIAVLFSLVAVSAADLITLSDDGTVLSKSKNTTFFTITPNSPVNISSTYNNLRVNDGNGNYITLQLSPTINEDNRTSNKRINVSYTIDNNFNFNIKKYDFPTITINAVNVSNSSINETKEIDFSFINSFCESGTINESNLELEVSIDNLGEGDDNEWYPLDEIEVEVEFTNDKNIDLDDVFLELGLIEEDTGKNIADDMIWISSDNEEVEIGNIDEDEDDYHIFNFKVDPEAGIDKSNYILVVKAYPDGEEDNICIDSSDDLKQTYYEEIDIKREDAGDDRAIFIDTEDILLTEASCNEQINIDADVYNIGDEDQEAVMVNLYNKDLGINLNRVLRRGLDEGDKEQVSFSFEVPKPQEEKTYYLELRAFYDYDDDYDIENSAAYDETSKAYTTALKLSNCKEEKKSVQISAKLDPTTPEAIAGEQVVVKTTLTNTGETETTYTISVSGNSAWAALNDINPKTITLQPGNAETSNILLTIDEEIEGEKQFNIQATFNGDSVEQPVSLNIQKSDTQQQIINHLKDNWFIYVIIIINIILIIAIIAVAKRLVRQPQAHAM